MKTMTKALVFFLLLSIISGSVAAPAVAQSRVEVVTAKQLKLEEERFVADIQIPAIRGLDYRDLQFGLNSKYSTEGKRFFRQFKNRMEDMKEGNLAAYSSYFVPTHTDSLMSIGRFFLWIEASGAESRRYDTIDLKNQILLSLPGLFKDESYVVVISMNIREQMKQQMAADQGKVYFVDEFKGISENQEFYITKEGKLVISFDEYTVAPGSMGVVEFTIPTEAIKDILVSNEYVR